MAAVLSSTTLSVPSPNSAVFQNNWLAMAPCGTATPFGTPVEPEVKMT
ncbi:Uncharacterised protein [Mycobacteroides abscessus subsp. abscessus]|nr:Uncharacterised protein [Mycobacteroides abscessus subsp. abscessus]